MAWGSRRYEYEDREDEKPDEEEIFGSGKWPFGGEGQLSDVPVPTGAVAQQISEMLSRADNNAGEYSFGGQANTLPAIPGLYVDGVGLIPVPLTEEHATKLMAKCDKSPFGRKLDTMMDENVRKSWQLAPDQVELKNPLWHTGMEKLSDTIAGRLGYKDIPMQCKLYKLLVYGEGGHFVKHQDTEKEDGMVATLVIQLPSVHEGGNLVVYRRGEVKYRHDFGKQEGTAEYLPHYAVHYADAEHALETVVSGFRLVLVYSICLPSTMRHLTRNHDQSLSEELGGVINSMSRDDESFALLLSHEYTEKSITELGSGALKGIDRARVQVLEEANEVASSEKKLQLFIAKLNHDISYYDDGGSWAESDRNESINWYSPEGDSHGIKMALQIADGLDEGVAQLALLNEAVTKALNLPEEKLCASSTLGLLWKWAIRCSDRAIFDSVAGKFIQTKPSLLQPVIDAFSQHIGTIDLIDDKFAVLTSIAGRRIEWLKNQLGVQGQSFSWEMPDAYFPDNAHVEAFLRGPNESMDTVGIRHFNGIKHARNYAAKWMRNKQINASFTLEADGHGQNAYVVITKTRSWFSQHQKTLVEYREELNRLSLRYGEDTTENTRKRARNIIGPEEAEAAAAAAGEYSFSGQADTLPVAPGLFIDGVGSIALPLCDEQAEKLVAKCDKSPFGRKLDTMMDENIRKSWQLAPDQVEIRNPLWHTGMKKLSETVAGRLGYKGVPMQCILYKMLVYGEGGHFVKHQDTEKEDGMVATMVVQLPSLHEGGDLIVYRVHYADAEHALEKVTKGYRLVLVYSICLPSNMRGLERNPDKSMTEELTNAITCMGLDDKLFSLLLVHEYTEKSITGMGSRALKGIDRARVDALMEANKLVPADKKLLFFFADLKHDAHFYDVGGDWEEDEHKESITWYSASGEKFSTASEAAFELNFLNPDQDTLEQIWEERGESTFEGTP
ncbi:hypothetical protein PHMEG_00025503 [Phytophthora megakarya]|uniref:Fe2OG dioxygenase domain-containing protein n=1 Tax=Phytophthora megakarya TaxID=4795 RepID=A0A225VAZ7_9STRA|nr:hypothetical protein PHMEG_00025503 [Phytophthora megakarya]